MWQFRLDFISFMDDIRSSAVIPLLDLPIPVVVSLLFLSNTSQFNNVNSIEYGWLQVHFNVFYMVLRVYFFCLFFRVDFYYVDIFH